MIACLHPSDKYLDENLLECNNLLNVIDFELLDSDTATELSKSIGDNKKFKDETKLVDVFNFKKDKNIKGNIGLK